MASRSKGIYLLLILTNIFWGINSVTAKFVLTELPPITIAFVRFGLITLLLMASAVVYGKFSIPDKNDLYLFIGMGITGVYLHNMLFFTGVKFSSAANATLISAVNPAIMALFSFFLYRETLRPIQIAGIFLSLLGVTVIITKGSLAVLFGMEFNFGDILLSITPVSWSVYSLIGRKLMKRYDPLIVTAYAGLFGAVLLLPTALLLEPGFLSLIHI